MIAAILAAGLLSSSSSTLLPVGCSDVRLINGRPACAYTSRVAAPKAAPPPKKKTLEPRWSHYDGCNWSNGMTMTLVACTKPTIIFTPMPEPTQRIGSDGMRDLAAFCAGARLVSDFALRQDRARWARQGVVFPETAPATLLISAVEGELRCPVYGPPTLTPRAKP